MVSGTVDRHNHRDDGDYYSQPGNLFRLMDAGAKQRLIENIAGSLGNGPKRIQKLQVQHFFKCDPSYGTGIAEKLEIKIDSLAAKKQVNAAD